MATEGKLVEVFDAAVSVIRNLPKDGLYQPSNMMRLKFYSLYKQATDGPCSKSKPSFWDIVNRAKWEAWIDLGTMDKDTAMSRYINQLKEIVETMPHCENVQTFMHMLEPFIEMVDDKNRTVGYLEFQKPEINGSLSRAHLNGEGEREGGAEEMQQAVDSVLNQHFGRGDYIESPVKSDMPTINGRHHSNNNVDHTHSDTTPPAVPHLNNSSFSALSAQYLSSGDILPHTSTLTTHPHTSTLTTHPHTPTLTTHPHPSTLTTHPHTPTLSVAGAVVMDTDYDGRSSESGSVTSDDEFCDSVADTTDLNIRLILNNSELPGQSLVNGGVRSHLRPDSLTGQSHDNSHPIRTSADSDITDQSRTANGGRQPINFDHSLGTNQIAAYSDVIADATNHSVVVGSRREPPARIAADGEDVDVLTSANQLVQFGGGCNSTGQNSGPTSQAGSVDRPDGSLEGTQCPLRQPPGAVGGAPGGGGRKDGDSNSLTPTPQHTDTGQLIITALSRLQHDMNSVLSRLQSLEYLRNPSCHSCKELTTTGNHGSWLSWLLRKLRVSVPLIILFGWPVLVNLFTLYMIRKMRHG